MLLKGVNDDAETLAELFRALVALRVKPYYLHHADLAPGTAHFRTTIAEGQAIMRALRGRVSGLALPTYVLDVPGGFGKVPVGPDYVSGAGGCGDDRGRRRRPPQLSGDIRRRPHRQRLTFRYSLATRSCNVRAACARRGQEGKTPWNSRSPSGCSASSNRRASSPRSGRAS